MREDREKKNNVKKIFFNEKKNFLPCCSRCSTLAPRTDKLDVSSTRRPLQHPFQAVDQVVAIEVPVQWLSWNPRKEVDDP